MTQAKPSKIIYTKRFPLAPYSHEEMTVEYYCDEGCTETAKEVLLRARTDVAQSSEAYIRAKKEEQKKETKT